MAEFCRSVETLHRTNRTNPSFFCIDWIRSDRCFFAGHIGYTTSEKELGHFRICELANGHLSRISPLTRGLILDNAVIRVMCALSGVGCISTV